MLFNESMHRALVHRVTALRSQRNSRGRFVRDVDASLIGDDSQQTRRTEEVENV